jgi:hypothetical protein
MILVRLIWLAEILCAVSLPQSVSGNIMCYSPFQAWNAKWRPSGARRSLWDNWPSSGHWPTSRVQSHWDIRGNSIGGTTIANKWDPNDGFRFQETEPYSVMMRPISISELNLGASSNVNSMLSLQKGTLNGESQPPTDILIMQPQISTACIHIQDELHNLLIIRLSTRGFRSRVFGRAAGNCRKIEEHLEHWSTTRLHPSARFVWTVSLKVQNSLYPCRIETTSVQATCSCSLGPSQERQPGLWKRDPKIPTNISERTNSAAGYEEHLYRNIQWIGSTARGILSFSIPYSVYECFVDWGVGVWAEYWVCVYPWREWTSDCKAEQLLWSIAGQTKGQTGLWNGQCTITLDNGQLKCLQGERDVRRLAPETIDSLEHTCKSDVWVMAILFWEAISGMWRCVDLHAVSL